MWDDIQLTLAVTGMFPVLGNLADFADGVISLARGQYLAAGLSFVAMIPIVGQLATAGKLGTRAYRAARRGRAVLRYARMGVGRTRVAQGLLRARAGVGRAAAYLASEVGERARSLLRREGDEVSPRPRACAESLPGNWSFADVRSADILYREPLA